RSFRLAPPAPWKQHFAGFPFDGIDRDDVDVTMEAPMLKAIIQNEDVSELPLLRQLSGLVPIGANDDGNIPKTLLHQKRFVAAFFPIRAHDQNAAAGPAVSAR